VTSRAATPAPVLVGALAALLTAVAAAAAADARLEVTGAVLADAPRLRVRVSVANRGRQPVSALAITGECLGERREARLPEGLPAGGSGSVVLDFAVLGARPGVHALALLLEHAAPGAPDAAGNPPLESRRAWLLLTLGAPAEPAVRLKPKPARLDVTGSLEVAVESTDGAPHRVTLRPLPARGLRAEPDSMTIDVPARGTLEARVRLVRAGAPRGTRHEVLLVAEAEDGPLARTTVATATVEIAPDPSILPRWRRLVLVGALLLLGLVFLAEAWLRSHRAT
jgi:hypothetical protein